VRWRKANPELAAAYDRLSHARQRQDPVRAQAGRAATRRWELAHPNECRERARRRRAHLYNAPVREPIDLDMVYARDRAICSLCHQHVKRAEASVDHIVPLSKGGEHSYKNVALAHFICNVRKNNRLATQQMRLF